MNKVVRPGRILVGKRMESIFCEIGYDDGRLSIHGVVGPRKSGNCRGSCGQIIGSFKEYDDRSYESLGDIEPAPGWDVGTIRKFFDLWDRWHLNDLKAGCEHQRELGWDKEPVDPSQPTTAYGKFGAATQTSWNLKGWLTESEGGYLLKPCPVCGYKYGSAWLREEVPQEVIDWLFGLPDTDKTPAWV